MIAANHRIAMVAPKRTTDNPVALKARKLVRFGDGLSGVLASELGLPAGPFDELDHAHGGGLLVLAGERNVLLGRGEIPRLPVDPLPDQVSVTVVPRVFLDHVVDHTAR
jgi:hypothetical protein